MEQPVPALDITLENVEEKPSVTVTVEETSYRPCPGSKKVEAPVEETKEEAPIVVEEKKEEPACPLVPLCRDPPKEDCPPPPPPEGVIQGCDPEYAPETAVAPEPAEPPATETPSDECAICPPCPPCNGEQVVAEERNKGDEICKDEKPAEELPKEMICPTPESAPAEDVSELGKPAEKNQCDVKPAEKNQCDVKPAEKKNCDVKPVEKMDCEKKPVAKKDCDVKPPRPPCPEPLYPLCKKVAEAPCQEIVCPQDD